VDHEDQEYSCQRCRLCLHDEVRMIALGVEVPSLSCCFKPFCLPTDEAHRLVCLPQSKTTKQRSCARSASGVFPLSVLVVGRNSARVWCSGKMHCTSMCSDAEFGARKSVDEVCVRRAWDRGRAGLYHHHHTEPPLFLPLVPQCISSKHNCSFSPLSPAHPSSLLRMPPMKSKSEARMLSASRTSAIKLLLAWIR
jgi:hypothetical protein